MENRIYSHISEQKLNDILDSLHAFTGLSIDLIDSNGTLLQSYRETTRYCSLLKKTVFTHNECFILHMKAGQRAQRLGEAYVFSCHANLNHIAFPLINQGELLGSVIIGPFLMDQPDSTLVSDLFEKYKLSPELLLDLYDELPSLQVMDPARTNHLKKLIDYLLSPLIADERALMLETQKKMYQQARINETIQVYKEQEYSSSLQYLHEREKALLAKVKNGDIQEVKELLNELIGYVLFSNGGKTDSIRTHAIELTTLLSRVAMDNGAEADLIYKLNSNFGAMMKNEQNLEALCQLLQEAAESFMDAMFHEKDKGNPYIRQALKYIAGHYSEHLTLASVAEEIKLSPNYFSTLFNDTVGIPFREYLNRVRVEESKRLLLSTDYSLTDIAIAMGFPDQSYYCKIFKSIIGTTPGKFRA